MRKGPYRRRVQRHEPHMLDEDDLAIEAAIVENAEACPTGKYIFKTAMPAAVAAKRMRTFHQDPLIHHYQCEHCSYWHTGHPPKSRRKLERMNEAKKGMNLK